MSIDTNFAHTITELIRNQKGEITAYKLENGETILKEEAIALAKQGVIRDIQISDSKTYEQYLTHLPDGDGNNNLGNLPIINVDKK
jgi:hypothetical protein